MDDEESSDDAGALESAAHHAGWRRSAPDGADQKMGASMSCPASTAPAVVSVSGLTRKCWVTA